MNDFDMKLEMVNWDFLYNFTDANIAYNKFIDVISSLYNSTCKLKRIRVKARHRPSPWITKSIINSINTKKKLYKAYICKPTQVKKTRYTIYRNKLTSVIRAAKKSYFAEVFEKINTI